MRANHNLFTLWTWADLDRFHAKVKFGRSGSEKK